MWLLIVFQSCILVDYETLNVYYYGGMKIILLIFGIKK